MGSPTSPLVRCVLTISRLYGVVSHLHTFFFSDAFAICCQVITKQVKQHYLGSHGLTWPRVSSPVY